jgi:predicted Zn-dependent protease
LLLAALALGTASWSAWRRVERRRSAQEAIHYAQHGLFSDAEPKLRAALGHDPDNAELLSALALGLLGTQQLNEADLALTRWCQAHPEDAEPFSLRMDLRHHQAQQAKPGAARHQLQELALADGRRVLELDPEDDATAEKVVWLCLAGGRFEEAERACRRCRERRPNDPSLLYLQARVHHARGANAEAQALLDALLGRLPQFTPGLLLRAILHYEADEAERAIPLLRRVLAEGGASHKEARYHLGLALARAGHADEARRVMAEVQRDSFEKETLRPGEKDSLAVRVRRAELLFHGGRADEALALLKGVLEEDPGCAAAHRLLASHYAGRGDSAKAAEHRRRAGP